MLTPVPESDCARARESMSARLDGELTELEAGFLDLHLSGCATCAGYAEDVEGAAALVRGTPLEQPNEPIFVARRLRHRRLPIPSAAAAAVAVAVVAGSSFAIGGLFASQGQRAHQQTTTRRVASGSSGPVTQLAPVIVRAQSTAPLRVPARPRVIAL